MSRDSQALSCPAQPLSGRGTKHGAVLTLWHQLAPQGPLNPCSQTRDFSPLWLYVPCLSENDDSGQKVLALRRGQRASAD